MERAARMAGALAIAACLAGCGNFGKSSQARINEALPPGSEVVANKARLDATVKSLALDPAPIEAEFQHRLAQRADECAAGYSPSWFSSAESIRDALPDKDCFVRVDADLQQWIGLRQAGLLLAAPPLRAVPKTPARLVPAAGFINRATFAERAGVAVLDSRGSRELVDLGTAEVIHADDGEGVTESLSPNGRLLTVRAGGEGVRIIEAGTGSEILTLPTISAPLLWVGDEALVHTPPRRESDGAGTHEAVLVDLANGKRHRLPITSTRIEKILPVPGRPGHFVAFSHGLASEFALQRSGADLNVRLLSEQRIPAGSWERESGVMPGAQAVFNWGEAISVIPLQTLQPRSITLAPMRVNNVVATPNPDQLLFSGYFMGDPQGAQMYLYSLGQRTIASVDKQVQPGRVVYIAALKRNAVIDSAKLVLLDALPVAQAMDINPFLEQRAEAAEQARAASMVMMSGDPASARQRLLAQMARDGSLTAAQYERMTSATARDPGMRASTAMPVSTAPGPLVEAARNARIEALGVYEGQALPGAARASHAQGVVRVQVRRSATPIILTLSAYEPVRWELVVEPGAQLSAVLSGGYYPAQVTGAGKARVYQIGRHHAYKRNGEGYAELEAEVRQWTGKPIDVFQGRYTGESFSVGM